MIFLSTESTNQGQRRAVCQIDIRPDRSDTASSQRRRLGQQQPIPPSFPPNLKPLQLHVLLVCQFCFPACRRRAERIITRRPKRRPFSPQLCPSGAKEQEYGKLETQQLQELQWQVTQGYNGGLVDNRQVLCDVMLISNRRC